MAESRKNLQLVDLGLDRRIEITTADDKRDPYAKFTEEDLDSLRKSVQDPHMMRLQNENRPLLNAWSNFHQEVKMEEGEFPDEPQLMNGQSHRAHLHFDMRSKEGLVSRPARPVAPSHQMPAGRKHHLDPALDPAKFTSGRPKQAVLAPGLSRPLAGNVQGGPRFNRSKGLKVQRRPIRAPPTFAPTRNVLNQNYEVKLADPGSWMVSARNKTSQPDTSSRPSTSHIETTPLIKAFIENQSVTITQPTPITKPVASSQLVTTTKPPAVPAATTQPVTVTKPTTTIQSASNTQPVTSIKPAGTVQIVASNRPVESPKLVTKLHNPFFGSNLPQPQTNASTPRVQSQPAKNEGLLLTFDRPPKKARPELSGTTTESDMMELDDGYKADSDTATANTLEKKLAWIQELGFINDTLADFSLSDGKQVKQLEDRRKKLQGMIHEASNRKTSTLQQTTTRPEKLTELSPTSLQKAVTARPFVPPPKPTFREAPAPLTVSLQASRWADPDDGKATTRKESPKKTYKHKKTASDSGDTVDYWQKTLPKLRPLPAQFTTTKDEPPASTSPSDKKPTKSMYESRYAC